MKPGPKPQPFFSKVERTGGSCWLWRGVVDRDGYGRYGSGRLAHRVSYETHCGPIAQGMEIDHLCRNRACVRPDHLEAVDRKTNCARTKGLRFTKTHCKQGHQYTPENTYTRPDGNRDCRACILDRVLRYKERVA